MAEDWFGGEDIPVLVDDGSGFPVAGWSPSGLEFTFDSSTRDDVRCGAWKDGGWVCLMPAGHDTPHLPAAPELVEASGAIVRSVRRGDS